MTSPERPCTAAEDRIALGQKLAYAVGMLVNNLQAAALPAMMVILNLGLGMDPALVGLIGFVPRIFDAVSDPMMGYISDNTRSRWGRRRPYILIGAILAGLVFAGMWQMPEGSSQTFTFWFFLVASVLYFLVYTVYATPFVAFGYEMTPDYHERTRLHAFANTAGQLAWLGVPWFYAIMASSLFENTAHGARVLALWVGGAIVLLGIVPAIVCRERMEGSKPAKGSVRARGFLHNIADFFQGIVTTFRCRPFVKLCAATFLVFNGFQLGMSFTLYVMIYYVFGGNDELAGKLNGSFGSLTALATVGVIPLTAWIAQRMGKRETFMITISISMVGYALKWVGYDPGHPNLLLIACPLVAFGTGSLFTLMGSMIADVCDHDELETGQRREGVFGAIYWWMVKVGMALATLLGGILLKVSGFITPAQDATEPVLQSADTLLYLRLFDVVIPIITSGIALAIMWRYEISEERAGETRAELERRRGRLGAHPAN
ncbi:MAG: MFS transporter [Planctomycetes bacterium]|nr:MFS transporter [Planctomycetota bacterium]